jgi:hypothetical protein
MESQSREGHHLQPCGAMIAGLFGREAESVAAGLATLIQPLVVSVV